MFYNLAIFYDSCSYLSSLLFLIHKTEFVSSFAFMLCSPFPFADWALLDCVIDRKVRDIIFEAILSPSERYQNIQDNPEYNSVLPYRIILNIFAVNMLVISFSFIGQESKDAREDSTILLRMKIAQLVEYLWAELKKYHLGASLSCLNWCKCSNSISSNTTTVKKQKLPILVLLETR